MCDLGFNCKRLRRRRGGGGGAPSKRRHKLQPVKGWVRGKEAGSRSACSRRFWQEAEANRVYKGHIRGPLLRAY